MRHLAFGSLATLVVALTACASNTSVSGEGIDSRSDPIFNGTLDGTAHPSVVSVITDMGNQGFGACSGTIIAVNGTTGYILTAGHCVYDTQGGQASPPTDVILGNDYNCFINGNCSSSIHHTVSGWTKAPGWTGDLNTSQTNSDFGLVKFEGASASLTVSEVLSPDMASSLHTGSITTAVGFGMTSGNDQSNTKRWKVDINADQVTADYLIHNQSAQNKGTCEGDSGGPHFLNVNGTDYVAAVTSYGLGNGTCETQDGYNGRPTKQAIYDWITSYVGGSTGTGGAAGSGGGTNGYCAGQSGWACDPVSTTSCDQNGGACDFDVNSGTFQCFGAPNDAGLGQPCDSGNGPYCAQGATCVNSVCVRYCCADSDCTSGSCAPDTDASGVTVGVCTGPAGTGGSAGSAGAAGSAGSSGSSGSAGTAGSAGSAGTAGAAGGTAGTAGSVGGSAGTGGAGAAGSAGGLAGSSGSGTSGAGTAGSGGSGGANSDNAGDSTTNNSGSCSASPARSSSYPAGLLITSIASIFALRRRRSSR